MDAILVGWSLAVGSRSAAVNQDTQEIHVHSVLQHITNMETNEISVLVRMLLIKSNLLLSVEMQLHCGTAEVRTNTY